MDIARSSLKLFISKIGSAVLNFGGTVYFANELGAAGIGSYFLFQSLLGILSIPADFGLSGAVEKRISEGDSQSEFLGSAVMLKLFPIIIISPILIIFQSQVNAYIGKELAIVLVIGLVVREISQLPISVLIGSSQIGKTAVLQFIQKFCWFFIGVFLVSRGFGTSGIVFSSIIGSVFVLLIGIWWMSIYPSLPTKEQSHSLLEYSRHNFISSIGGYFYSWMDVAILGLLLPNPQALVGAYEVAWRITSVTVLLSQSIAKTIFPQVSQWDTAGTQERIEDLIPNAIIASSYLVIPSFFGILLFSEEILRLVFDPEYTVAWFVLIILMGDKVFQSVQVVVGKSLQAIDKPDLAARATIASVISNLVLNLLLVSQFGLVGAAVATVLSSLLNDGLHLYYLKKFVSINFPYKIMAEFTFSSIGMFSLLWLLSSMFPVNDLTRLVSFIILGGVVYFGLSLLSPELRENAKLLTKKYIG